MPLVMRRIMRRLAILASLAVSATAAAEPPGLTQPVMEEGAPSYRAEIIATDVVGTALLLGGAASAVGGNDPNTAVLGLGLVTYGLGGPIVHLAHHHTARALESLALRIVAPILTAEIGSQLRTCFVTASSDCDVQSAADSHAAIGLLVGAVAAMTIDSAVLGGPEPAHPGPSWAPTVGASRSAVSLGVAGTF